MAKKYTQDDVPEEIKAKFAYIQVKPSVPQLQNTQKLPNDAPKDQPQQKDTTQQFPMSSQFRPPIQEGFQAPCLFGPMPKDAIKYTNDDVPEHIRKRFPQFNTKQEYEPERLKDEGKTAQQVPQSAKSQNIPFRGQFLQSPSSQQQPVFSPPQFQQFGTPLSYSNVFVPPKVQQKSPQQNAPQGQQKVSQLRAEKKE